MKICTRAMITIMMLWGIGCDSGPQYSTAASALSTSELMSQLNTAQKSGRKILDVQGQQLLVGTLQSALAHTDAPRLFNASLLNGGQPVTLPESLDKLEDIRFVPGQPWLLAITEDHRLLRIDGTKITTLDRRAFAPMSISPSGRFVTYARGEAPLFSVVRRPIDQLDKVSIISGDMLGCWSPAVDDDGHAFFVSSTTGHAELYRVMDGKKPQKMTTLQSGQVFALPSGPGAPHLTKTTLYYEHAGDLYALAVHDADVFSPKKVRANTRPIWMGQQILFQAKGKWQQVALKTLGVIK